MIKWIRATFRRIRGNAVLIYSALVDPLDDEDDEREAVGATEDWRPLIEVSAVHDFTEESQAELDERAAATELEPLFTEFHRAMGRAFRAFDVAMLAPMQKTARWHAAGRDCCRQCAEQHARTFGAIGERFGIRSFRVDTPTAAFQILGV